MHNTLTVAMEEVSSYNMYAAKPFDKSAEYRAAIKDYINNTCANDQAAVREFMERGSSREAALEKYISDEAFEKWFSNLEEIIKNI